MPINFLKGHERGALLLSLIVTMVVLAAVGGGMLYYTSTSSYGGLLANTRARAYYLGEAGANYALQQFLANQVADGPFPALTTFTVGEDHFAVRTYDQPGDPSRLVIESTGVAGSGWLATRQSVTKNILKATATPPGQPPSAPVGFDLNSDKQLDASWTPTAGTDASIVNTGKSGGPALMFKGETGAIDLNWYNNAPAPDLLAAWNNYGGLLSYALQIKINIENKGKRGDYYMMGLSFRLVDDDNSYGISFYRSNGTSGPSWWASDAFGDLRTVIPSDGKNYAVLWKKVNGTYTALDYTLLTYDLSGNYGDVVTDATSQVLNTWSSIIIRVDEKFDGAGGARQNHLKVYVQSPTIYPPGTVNWNYGNFKPIVWTWTQNPPQPAPPITEVLESSLTSDGFGSTRPEIGLHAFYDAKVANDQFFTDFGMAVKGIAASGGGYQY